MPFEMDPTSARGGNDEKHNCRALIEEVRSGGVSRRSFVQRMAALGLTAPMATQLLMHAGVAQAQTVTRLQADQARRRRDAEGAVLAGRRRC